MNTAVVGTAIFRTFRKVLPGLSAALAALTAPSVALAVDSYPSRPIELVVTYPPGGSSDTSARQISGALSSALRQPITIINKGGAGGAIGAAYAARANPDGYTLMMGLSSMVTVPESDRLDGRKPLYEVDQFEPIARVSADPLLIVVRSDSPHRSLRDLADAAKKAPGTLNFASSGNYGPSHMAFQLFTDAAGIEVTHVPFAGAPGTVTAILGGEVDFTIMAPPVALPHMKAGKIRALGVSSVDRLPSSPDVPTFREQGYDAEYYLWTGVFAPVGTPQPVLTSLRDAIRTAVQDPQFQKGMNAVDSPPAYLDAPEFKKFIQQDSRRLVQAVHRMGKAN